MTAVVSASGVMSAHDLPSHQERKWPDACSEVARPGTAMVRQKHTRKRRPARRKVRKQPKRVTPWKELIGLASLAWNVFRFFWEHGHRGSP